MADIIVTAAPVYQSLAALSGGERFPKGAQLLLLHQGKAEPLVTGFAATADANVSFDGKTVLFAGKHAATDPWQIWELTVATHAVRKVIDTTTDAIRPLYCSMCGKCDGHCQKGLPVADVLRYLTYADGYAQP